MSDLRAGDGYRRWTRRTDGPLLVLAIALLIAFLIPLYVTALPASARVVLTVVSVVVWVAFAVDYLTKLLLAPERWTFVRSHWADLLVLVVPLLRPLRLLRLVGLFGATTRRLGGRAQVRTTAGALLAVAVLVVVCAGLVLDAERGQPGANIVSVSDALWWASTTVTTVGYGDRFPTTGEGRMVGVLLMLGGIALLGVLTASIAAWFVRRFSAVEELERVVEAEGDATARLLKGMSDRLERLERLFEERLPERAGSAMRPRDD